MQKVSDPAVRHTGSGALIRRFLPYLAKYKHWYVTMVQKFSH